MPDFDIFGSYKMPRTTPKAGWVVYHTVVCVSTESLNGHVKLQARSISVSSDPGLDDQNKIGETALTLTLRAALTEAVSGTFCHTTCDFEAKLLRSGYVVPFFNPEVYTIMRYHDRLSKPLASQMAVSQDPNFHRTVLFASLPMCSVFSAISGERLAVVDEWEGKTVEQLKRSLAAQLGVSRFRQRLLDRSELWDEVVDSQLQVVLLQSGPDPVADKKMIDAAYAAVA